MKKFLFLLLFIPSILFGADLTPTGWVNDYTGLLTTEQVNSLNNKIAKFEKQNASNYITLSEVSVRTTDSPLTAK
jgi:uncharacterized membrane protein YgcG